MGEFKRGWFFTPWTLKFREPAYKRRGAQFVVLVVEPHPVPSPKRSLHRKDKEAGARVGLEIHASDYLAVSSTRLVFQEKVVPE
jgi:hypothetical protein